MLATASRHFQEVLSQLPTGDNRIPFAKQRIKELAPRLPHLRIRLAAAASSGAVVMLDGVPIDPASLGAELPVDPGKHTVRVTAGPLSGRRYEVLAQEGKTATVDVEPEPARPVIVPVPRPHDTGRPADDLALIQESNPPLPSSGNTRRTAGFVVGGAGIAGLALGSVTGLMALSRHSAMVESCSSKCPPDIQDQIGTGKTLSVLSPVGFVVGAVGVGLGIYLVLSSSRSSDSPSVGLTVLPGGAGLRGTF